MNLSAHFHGRSKFMISLDQTDAEQDAIQPLLNKISKNSDHVITLDHLLNAWSLFVARLTIGYNSTAYEYANDLANRDILQRILEESPDSLKVKLSPILRELDDRFLEETYSVANQYYEGSADWWRRIPFKASPGLKNDLLAILSA